MSIPRTIRRYEPGIICACVLAVAMHSANAQAGSLKALEINAIWSGTTGTWTDASNWTPKGNFPNNDGLSYCAVINSGSVFLNKSITVDDLALGEAGVPILQGSNTLNVRSNLHLNQGLIAGTATLNALERATVSGSSNLYGCHVTLSGRTTWFGRLGVGNAGVIDNAYGATLDLSDGAVLTYGANPSNYQRMLNNYGTINANGAGAVTLDATLNNPGTINVNSGSLVISNGGTSSGMINVALGTTLDFERTNVPSGTNYVFTETSSISGPGSVKFSSEYSFSIRGVYNVMGTTTVGGPGVSFISPITNLGNSVVITTEFGACDLGSNSVTLNSLNLKRGVLTGSGTVTVNTLLEWDEGSMTGTGTTNALGGVFFHGLTDQNQFDILSRTLNCYGSSSVQLTQFQQANLYFDPTGVLNIMPGATFNGSHLVISGSDIGGETWGIVTNYGTLVVNAFGANPGMGIFGTAFVNEGNIQISNTSLDVRSTTDQPSFVQNSGSVDLSNGSISGTSAAINGGILTGYGTVANLVNNGFIAPSRVLACYGDLTLLGNSVLAYVLNGTQPGVSYGQINDNSTATLGGTLQVTLSASFQSQVSSSDIFVLLSAQSITGQFANVASGSRLFTAEGFGSFVVTYSGNSVILSNFLPSALTTRFPSSSRQPHEQ